MSSNIENRNDEPDELARVGGSVPNWITRYQEEDQSLATLQKYRIIPRIGITQGMTKEHMKKAAGGVGVAWIPSSKTVIAKEGDTFEFVPLFFYPEYIKWRDRRDKSGHEIFDRTLDPTSEIARRAEDAEQRYEEYEGSSDPNKPFQMAFLEHLCFIGVIYDGEFAGTELVISFSRGEWKTGKAFGNQIIARKVGGKSVPLYLQVWEFVVGAHNNKSGNEWYGFNIRSAEIPFIRDNQADTFQQNHMRLKEQHEKRQFVVEQSEDEDHVDESEKPVGDL